MDDELNLTEDQEKMLEEWLKKFEYLLGYTMMKEWLDTESTMYASLSAASLMASLLEGLMSGTYPYPGKSPECGEDPDCANSIWDGIICNVGEEVASIVKIAFTPQGDDVEDFKEKVDSDKEKFQEIYGSFINDLFGDGE